MALKTQTTEKTRTHFPFRIDVWTANGESIVGHVAGVEDYESRHRSFLGWGYATSSRRLLVVEVPPLDEPLGSRQRELSGWRRGKSFGFSLRPRRFSRQPMQMQPPIGSNPAAFHTESRTM